MEFSFGDRVRLKSVGTASAGTVMDERNPKTHPILGSFEGCLPVPVVVLWDEPGECWWENGNLLEMA